MIESANQALQAASTSANHYHDASALTRLKHVSRDNPEQAAKEVATQFEAMFIQMMLKSMREAVPKGGLFNSNDMETYTEMADQQIAINLAKSGGIGLADVITRQLTLGRGAQPSDAVPVPNERPVQTASLELRVKKEAPDHALKLSPLQPITEQGQ
jgi:flagellar protein FlgJ